MKPQNGSLGIKKPDSFQGTHMKMVTEENLNLI